MHALCLQLSIMTAMSDSLHVPRAEFSIDEPWAVPPACNPVRLRRAEDAAPPRLATTVAAYFDDEQVTFVFSATDDDVVATMYGHDLPLYEEDVVEVFLAPRALTEYFEFEVSPTGATFDASIVSPDGVRATMKVDRAWNCEGLFAAVSRRAELAGMQTLDVVIRIPFASIGQTIPASGEEWRGNFFRIDRHLRHGDEYSAWHPTMRSPADFHVAAAFGRIVFA